MLVTFVVVQDISEVVRYVSEVVQELSKVVHDLYVIILDNVLCNVFHNDFKPSPFTNNPTIN